MLCLLFQTCVNAFVIEYDGKAHNYTGNIFTLKVNGEVIKTPLMPPIVINDRTLVPVRELCEALGATVTYKDGVINIKRGNDIIIMEIGENKTRVNGEVKKIPDGLTPKLINYPNKSAKTMVPARFIAETLGKEVEFDSKTDTVLIYDTKTENNTTSMPSIIEATYSVTESSKLILTLTADDDFSDDVSSFTLPSPTRVVFDIPNTSLKLKSNTLSFSDSVITTARFGHDGINKTRVVIDVSGEVLSYKATVSSDTLTIIVRTEENSDEDPTPKPTKAPDKDDEGSQKVPVSTQTPKPSTTPSPSSKPTQTPEGELPSSGPVVTPDSYKDINKKIIVLDAGHGGTDPGAVSDVLGNKTVNEKDITLGIAKKVRDILEANGYTVVMTRDSDTYPTLNKRSEIANRAGAALFVSIHMNSSPSSDPSGTETYYSEINNGDDFGITSEELAKSVQNKLYKALDSRNRGVKTANHAVTRNSIMPAILIEVGFISNAKQAELLLTSSYQQKAASAIAQGIVESWEDITVPKNWDSLVLKRLEALK